MDNNIVKDTWMVLWMDVQMLKEMTGVFAILQWIGRITEKAISQIWPALTFVKKYLALQNIVIFHMKKIGYLSTDILNICVRKAYCIQE